MNRLSTGLLTASLLTLAVTAQADSLRCGKNLISDGDSTIKVLSACGEPIMKKQVIFQAPITERYRNDEGDWTFKESSESRSAELWYYKPNRLLYSVRFEEGKLVSVSSD